MKSSTSFFWEWPWPAWRAVWASPALTTWAPSFPPPQSVHVACATVEVPLRDGHVLEPAATSALNASVVFAWESSELIRQG